MKQNKKKIIDILLLVFFLLAAGIYCVWAGQDANWDLQNYHLYNPFAFLHNRYEQDLFAAGVHSTMNPILDIPYYLLFRLLFHHPVLLAFLWGLPYGLCIWLMYKIAECVFLKNEWWWKIFTISLSATAVAIFLQAGLVTGEVNNLVTLLISIWCFVIFVKDSKKVKFLYWAGFLAGFAAGCKLTAGYYCVALFAALIPNIRHMEKPLKTMVMFCLLGAAGFLLTNGYFMWKWYSMYGNPFFPYFNNIFNSPYFAAENLIDPRFFPHTLLQWLFYPFYWIEPVDGLVIECRVADKRLALGYIAAVVLIFRLLWGGSFSMGRRLVSSLVILTVVSYLGWLYEFSILRYTCVIEFLACLLIFIALDFLVKQKMKIGLAVLIVCMCICTVYMPDWQHEKFRKGAVVEFTYKPEIEDNALVFFMTLPTSYLAVLLNPKASYMGGFLTRPAEYPKEYRAEAASNNNLPLEYFQYHMEDLQREKIAKHDGPIYIISVDWPMIRNKKTLARYGLKPTAEPCTSFRTNLTVYSPSLAICPVAKITGDEKEEDTEKETKTKNGTKTKTKNKSGNKKK